MAMDWQTWFAHDDGTPRVVYLELQGKSELVLADVPGGCELNVKLGSISPSGCCKTFTKLNSKCADPDTQNWAVQEAVKYLTSVAAEAAALRDMLSNDGPSAS